MAQLISQAAYARRIGVSKQAISAQVKAGLIPTHGPRELIDPDEADQARQQNLAPRKEGVARAGVYSAARAKREFYLARLAEMEVKHREGELVEAIQVEKEWFQVLRIVRDRLLSLPDRVFQSVAAETDPMKVHEMLKVEVRSALIDLAKDIEDRGAA